MHCNTATTFHFRGITHAIKKARVFEGRAECVLLPCFDIPGVADALAWKAA
jgi:hypothetical protein